MEPRFPYRQVADDLCDKIMSGELPMRARLAEESGAADMTIGRSIQEVRDADVVYTVPGLGMYIAKGDKISVSGERKWGACRRPTGAGKLRQL